MFGTQQSVIEFTARFKIAQRGLIAAVGVVALSSLVVTPAAAQTAAASLTNCQKAVRVETAKFMKKKLAAVTACLQKVATNIVKSNSTVNSTTARLCVKQFRKLYDSRNIGVSLRERLTNGIKKKCEPGNPGVLHTFADISGIMNLVPQPLDTMNINSWCQRFGGDGSIDSVQEWIDCLEQAHGCDSDSGVSVEYPRALEWFDQVATAIMALPPPPSTDPNRYNDALTALTTLDVAIDGAVLDNIPGIECGSLPTPVCSKACCYVEQPVGSGGPTSCFEYEGDSGEVSAFIGACNGKVSSPPGFWKHTGASGACTVGPMSGIACSSTSSSNFTLIPKDSRCL